MASQYGKTIKISLFGQTGQPSGAIIDGLPRGLLLEQKALEAAAGPYKLLSGADERKTLGAPLAVVFAAEQASENEADAAVLRPGTADIGLYKKYGCPMPEAHLANEAVRSLCFAGTLCKSLLATKQIKVYSHIYSICEVQDESFENIKEPERGIPPLRKDLPVLDGRKEMLMKLRLAQAENAGETLGGQVEVMVLDLPAGLGDPVFEGLKAKLSALLFSLPRVTAVEFGSGVGSTLMSGSEYNDEPYVDTLGGRIATRTNHAGGVQEGISNGMPLLIRVSFAPSPAIGKAQPTVHRTELRDVTLPSYSDIVTCTLKEDRVLTEAAVAYALADLLA